MFFSALKPNNNKDLTFILVLYEKAILKNHVMILIMLRRIRASYGPGLAEPYPDLGTS